MEADNIFENAMKGRWDEIFEAFKKKPSLQKEKITKSEDTALHIAVSDGRTKEVLKLVELIGENASRFLDIKNDKGNTPLHLAAALGNVEMCHCLAKKDRKLIESRNNESETPLFLSALHGKKNVFLCLHFLYKEEFKEINYSLCRKSNGDTILHSAISGEYFSLAFQIICRYPDLVIFNNEVGLSPLHILASKPKAFESGSHYPPHFRLIYRCILVDELQEEAHDTKACSSDPRVETGSMYPPNYETCWDIFSAIWNFFKVLTRTQGKSKDEENAQPTSDENPPKKECKQKPIYPPNCATSFLFFKLLANTLLVILGFGFTKIKNIREKKERHTWAVQIMNDLVQKISSYKYHANGRNPNTSWPKSDEDPSEGFPDLSTSKVDMTSKSLDTKNVESTVEETKKIEKKETPILLAAEMGVTEIVDKILDTFPVAIEDLDSHEKNVVLLAVENRQTDVYNLLITRAKFKERVFRQVDEDGNSALHLAANFGDYRPWLIPGAALQMQWEIKWYKFVKKSMPHHFFIKHNSKGQTAKEIFTDTHKELLMRGSEWLTKTSESCSVVAALIATVAFATSSTVPGGINQENGEPTLQNEPAFDVFAIASLVALCFSVTALIFFLTILTSRYQEKDFKVDLPTKLFLGLTSLFASIASVLLSFCSGHFFVLKENLRSVAYPLYAATCLPVTFFALAQLPLYFDLVRAILKKTPQRSYKRKVSMSRT